MKTCVTGDPCGLPQTRWGIRQRARLVAWKDCRSLARPRGSLADHEHGDTGLAVPPERKLDTRGGPLGRAPRDPWRA